MARDQSENPSLAKIIVLWKSPREQGNPPVDLIDSKWQVPVEVVLETDNDLSERFKRLDGIRTRGVMIRDEDITVQSSDLEFGFRAWQAFPTLVGFVPRTHHYDGASNQWKYDIDTPLKYSMVLTGVSFIHVALLDAFYAPEIKLMRAYVNKVQNCEDILMNFVVQSATGKPAALIKGRHASLKHWRQSGCEWGPEHRSAPQADVLPVSNLPGHWNQRSECLNHFMEYFGPNGLRFHDFTIQQAVDRVQLLQDPFTPGVS